MNDGPSLRLSGFDQARLDELVLMWRASLEAALGIVDPHPVAEHKRYFLTEVLPRNTVRLALIGDRLVGFVAANAESVAQLHVRVGYQRRGIGTQLLAWAKAQSSGSLWLYTFARNQAARAFYERNGFVAVAHGFEPEWKLEDVKYEWSEERSSFSGPRQSDRG
jgi:ribosomal protein S18 acetylase RimI-like enzyme